jgi:hypothetical protein
VYVLARWATRRSLVSKVWSTISALGYLSLPLSWTFTQARFIGEELDLMVGGCIGLALLALFVSIHRRSLGWAALAGFATGLGVLVKSVLALTPIGVALCLYVLSKVRFCKGPRLGAVVLMLGVAAATLMPWNIYAARRWPDTYREANADARVHIFDHEAAKKAPQWRRPVDAVFNEINQMSYAPTPHVLMLLVGVWLLIRAIRSRDFVVVGVALWLWATWLGHSVVAIKISSHLWNSVAAGFVGVAIVLEDIWLSLALACSVAAGLATPFALEAMPRLSSLRESFPALSQTRVVPGLAEGAPLIVLAAVVGALVARLWRGRGEVVLRAGVALGCTVAWSQVLLFKAAAQQTQSADEARPTMGLAYSRVVGQGLEALTPHKSLLLLDVDSQPYGQFEHHNLMFWSDRLVHLGRDAADYPAGGYHPYLVSPAAEPFAPLAIPADAWLRAYDLTRPRAEPVDLPPDATVLNLKVGAMNVLAFASGKNSLTQDNYVFYVSSHGAVPTALPVTFELRQGERQVLVEPEASLRSRQRLANAPWFLMPTVGPRRADVVALKLGGQRVELR